jgi:hypothetical protein
MGLAEELEVAICKQREFQKLKAEDPEAYERELKQREREREAWMAQMEQKHRVGRLHGLELTLYQGCLRVRDYQRSEKGEGV